MPPPCNGHQATAARYFHPSWEICCYFNFPTMATFPQWPFNSASRVAIVERFDCITFPDQKHTILLSSPVNVEDFSLQGPV